MRLGLSLLIGLLAGLLLSSPAAAERRVALVVGNAKYDNAPTLRNPDNDASDMAAALRKLGFEVILGLDLDEAHFGKVVDTFARRLDGADVGLFFYAGHGLQINEKNYLVSTNAKLESEFLVPSETIELNAVIRLMESRTPVNLVFLDACRNNPLAENLKRSLAAQKRSIALGRGLATVQPSGRDTLVAFSAAPGREASDGQGRNSPFTGALLKHVSQRGVEVSVMLKEVTADVRDETHGEQRPQQLSDMSRTFYFAKAEDVAVKPAEKPAPLPPPPAADDHALELAFWQSVSTANDCGSVRAYLKRFPNGSFVDLARLSEQRLCGPAAKVVTAAPAPPPAIIALPQKPAAPSPNAAPAPSRTNIAALPQGGGTEPPPAATSLPQQPAALPPNTPAPAASRTNIAALPQSGGTEPAPARLPDTIDIARSLQSELLRVGCGTGTIKVDGIWGPASRAALRQFDRHAKANVDSDRASPEALAAVRSHGERVCPIECGDGSVLRGGTCVAIREPARPRRQANHPPERPRRVLRRADERERGSREARPSGTGSSAISESDIFVGNRKCRTLDVEGLAPRIICR